MFVGRYADLQETYDYNFQQAKEAIDDEFEDNEPHREADVENRRKEILPGWVDTYREEVLARINRTFLQIEHPSQEDRAKREGLVREVRERFDGLTANIDAVCNAALEKVRAEQASAQQAERAQLVDESSEDEEELMEELENEEELEEPAPPEFPPFDVSQIKPPEQPPAA